MLPLLFAVLVGAVLPLQTAINTRLRGALGSPLRASFASFCVGAASLVVAVLASGASLALPSGFIASQPWWIWLGGAFGVVFLTGNILLFPRLGGVQTVVMPILGQILAADVIDSLGWFSSAVRPWSPSRAVGTCAAIVGMLLVVVGPDITRRKNHGAGTPLEPEHDDAMNVQGMRHAMRWIWQLAGIGTGVLSAMQTSVNGTLGVRLHSAIKAALVSFLIGVTVLAVMVIVEALTLRAASVRSQDPVSPASRKTTWWFWLGGLLGALFVYGNAMLSPVLGTGLTVVVVLLGQLTGSLAVDQFGLLGAERRPVKVIQLCGVVVLMAGAALMRLG